MLIENLGLAYAQLVDTMENHTVPPDGANMPEARSDWQRPPRRSSGLPSEQSYGGCGGCSGNFGGKCGGLGLTGAWNFGFSSNSGGGYRGLSGKFGGGFGGSGPGGYGGAGDGASSHDDPTSRTLAAVTGGNGACHCAHVSELLKRVDAIELRAAATERGSEPPQGAATDRGEDPWQRGYEQTRPYRDARAP